MINFGTKLFISDNSGGKLGVCIKILRSNYKKKFAIIGDIIKVVINKCSSKGKVKKGEIYNSLIIRTIYPFKRVDSYLKFSDNSIVLLNDKFELIGSRIFGPICKEIKLLGFLKIISNTENIV